MGRVPGLGRWRLVLARAVVMAHHGHALGAALRPVAAGHVLIAGKGGAVCLRAGEDVVLVRLIAAALHHLALLAQGRLLGEIVAGAVQVRHVLGDDGALGVLPRTAADAVFRIGGRSAARALSREIGAPHLAANAGSLGQGLAMPVRSFETAEIRALAGTDAGDEERGVLGALGLSSAHGSEGKKPD